jgi:hypothetical protein
MRTRRIIWLLAVLLTAFAVPSSPGVRVVNFAEVGTACEVAKGELQCDEAAVETSSLRVFPGDRSVVLYSSRESRASLWLCSYFRFQRPPPASLSV